MIGFLILCTIGYSVIAISMHWKYLTYGLDLGYFDEAIWKISQGKFPYSGIGCIWLLDDHFQVLLYLLAPLYWFWDGPEVILIAQVLNMMAAAYVLYLFAYHITKHIWLSYSIVIAFVFFVGTQFAILNEFHQTTLAPLWIFVFYLSIEKRRRTLSVISIVSLLAIKEDMALLVSAIGLGLLWKKQFRLVGGIMGLFGGLWFFFCIYVLLPSLSFYRVYSHMDFGSAGFTPFEVLSNMIRYPFQFIVSLGTPFVKIETVFRSFATFGFLPVFAPMMILIPVFEDFVTRFLYAGPQVTKWGLVNHHAAPSAALLAISAVYASQWIRKQKVFSYLTPYRIAVMIMGMALIMDIMYHGPIHSIVKSSLYHRDQWMRDADDIISSVPANVSVSSQNNLLPHLAHRDDVYRFPYGLNSEYMVFSLHDSPNAFAPLTYVQMREMVFELITTGRYEVILQKGDSMLLKRKKKTDISNSPYYNDRRYCYYSFEER